jgi:hypothetical protein
MKTVIAAVLFSVSLFGQNTITCNSGKESLQAANSIPSNWRFSINLQFLNRNLDVILTGSGLQVSGAIYPGLTEHVSSVGYSGVGGGCSVQIQTYSLLEQNGTPYGNRVTQYNVFVSETYTLCCNGQGIGTTSFTAKGLVKFWDYDLNGNLITAVIGTLVGVPLPVNTNGLDQTQIDFSDSFWSLRP